MSNTWQVNYDEIKGFVAQHPSIQIKPDVFSIPSEVRPDFYRLADSLGENFIRDKFSASLEKAYTLSSNHERIRSELTTSLAVEEIEVKATIKEFLSNPMGHLIKLLFDPLFDLLMGKINPGTFEEMSTAKLQLAFDTFFQQAYESWLILSLLQLMAPDEAYIVPPPLNDFANECDSAITDSGGLPKQMVPDAVQARRFSFDSTTFVSYLVPKVIVHSKRLNLFVSLVSEFRNVPLRVVYLNQNVEWFMVSELYQKIGPGRIWPDLAIYLAKQPNDLIMVADNRNIARPDMIMHIEHEKDLREPGKPDMLKNRNEVFAPRLGSFVICPEILPEVDVETFKQQFRPLGQQIETAEAPVKTGEAREAESVPSKPTSSAVLPRGIDVICVGYDAAKLEPIANTIIESQHYVELTSNPDR